LASKFFESVVVDNFNMAAFSKFDHTPRSEITKGRAESIFTGKRRNAEMLEARAKSSNVLSALPDRLSSRLFARAT
jgi:hypothetical protein